MTNSTVQVVAGRPMATGGALNAPLGTPLPTDESKPLDPAFTGVGYISEDGVGLTPNRSAEGRKAWGGDTVLVVQVEFGVEVKISLIEALNSTALRSAFGTGNVATTEATETAGTRQAVRITSTELDHLSWVFEVKSGAKRIRVVLPDTQVTAVDEIKFTDTEAVAYALTITCFPDADGTYAYQYSDDGVTAV